MGEGGATPDLFQISRETDEQRVSPTLITEFFIDNRKYDLCWGIEINNIG